MPKPPPRPRADRRGDLALRRRPDRTESQRQLRRAGPRRSGAPRTPCQDLSAPPDGSNSVAAAERPAPESCSAAEELHRAADRWAAMIIEAYLCELRAADEEREEKPN